MLSCNPSVNLLYSVNLPALSHTRNVSQWCGEVTTFRLDGGEGLDWNLLFSRYSIKIYTWFDTDVHSPVSISLIAAHTGRMVPAGPGIGEITIEFSILSEKQVVNGLNLDMIIISLTPAELVIFLSCFTDLPNLDTIFSWDQAFLKTLLLRILLSVRPSICNIMEKLMNRLSWNFHDWWDILQHFGNVPFNPFDARIFS